MQWRMYIKSVVSLGLAAQPRARTAATAVQYVSGSFASPHPSPRRWDLRLQGLAVVDVSARSSFRLRTEFQRPHRQRQEWSGAARGYLEEEPGRRN
jgi:hypothetical protein